MITRHDVLTESECSTDGPPINCPNLSASISVSQWDIETIRDVTASGGLHALQVRFDCSLAAQEWPFARLRNEFIEIGRQVVIGICVQPESIAFHERSNASLAGFPHIADDALYLCNRLTNEFGGIVAELSIDLGPVPTFDDLAEVRVLRSRLHKLTSSCADAGIPLRLVTGGTDAHRLLRLIEAAERGVLDVEFDPARFVCYGAQDPSLALPTLMDRVAVFRLTNADWDRSASGRNGGRYLPPHQGSLPCKELLLRASSRNPRLAVQAYLTEESGVPGNRFHSTMTAVRKWMPAPHFSERSAWKRPEPRDNAVRLPHRPVSASTEAAGNSNGTT